MASSYVRVCQKEYPKGTCKHQRDDGFLLDSLLKQQIDILLQNITNDWDFTIIISGEGEVRVGKSVLALEIAAYWVSELKRLYDIEVPFNCKDNIIFDGNKLIEKGNYLGKNHPYSPLIYDEAGADLEGRKTMTTVTRATLDFYRECGQYNLLNILVLPEYFDLPRGIALSRSIFLLNVTYSSDASGKFLRGYFSFYSRKNKKFLFLKGRKDLNYRAYQYNFSGRFPVFYPVPEDEYRKAKQEALSRRQSSARNKFRLQRDACWYLLTQEFGMKQEDLAKRMENLTGIYVAQSIISDGIRHFKMENE